eukprot:PhF_6_TR1971/c0_g1_i2/m.3264
MTRMHILLFVISLGVYASYAQTPTSIRFNSNPNDSQVNAPGGLVSAVQNTALFPPIIIELLNGDGTMNTIETAVSVTATCSSATLSGNVVQFSKGQATFSDLAVTMCPATPCNLVFTADGGVDNYPVAGKTLTTGAVTVEAIPNHDMKFMSTSSLQADQPGTVALNVAFQPIAIQIITSCGVNDNTNTGMIVSATSSSGTLTGASATTTDGVALFSTLMFTAAPLGNSVALTFTADPTNAHAFSVSGKMLLTGTITIASSVTPNTDVRFRTSSSFFTLAGQSGEVKVNTALTPAVVLELLDSAGNKDTSNSVAVVTASVSGSSTGLSGFTATFAQGVATFSALTFVSCSPSWALLTFTVGTGAGAASSKTLVTGNVSIAGVSNSALRFAPTGSSFTAAGQTYTVSAGVGFVPIVIRVTDSCGNFDGSANGVVITATTDKGTLSGSTTATVTNGVATFNTLLYTTVVTTPTLTFTAGTQGGYPVAGQTLSTGLITMFQAAVDLRFSTNAAISEVTAPNLAYKTILNVDPPLPFVIEILDSTGNVDKSVNDVLVTASCGTNLLENYNVITVNGVASFTSLRFKSCVGACQLRFTADGGFWGYPVENKYVQTGAVSVDPIDAADVTVSPLSYLQLKKSVTVSLNSKIPATMLQLVNSCGDNDETTLGVDVVASVDSGALSLTPADNNVTFNFGTAVFTNLYFTKKPSTATVSITFTVGSLVPVTATGVQLLVGPITVLDSVVPKFDIKFRGTNSFFTAQDQGFDLAVNVVPSPAIVVLLVDSAGVEDTTENALTITVSGPSEISGTSARMTAGVATFSSFKFTQCLSTQVKLTFTAGTEGTTMASGKKLVSGAVTVNGVANNMIAFSKTGSFITAAGQAPSTTVGVSVPIPTIQIELQDSCGNLNASVNGVIITASSDKASLGGTTSASITNGIAKFSNLMFASASSSPMLTFTVGNQLPNIPAAGTTLITGAFVVQMFAANIRFTTKSYVTAESIAVSVVQGAPFFPPFAIELLDGNGVPDTTTDSPITVTATWCDGTVVAPSATMTKGTPATFTNLVLNSCPINPCALTFTANGGPTGMLPVGGKTLVTGLVTVTPMPAYDMVYVRGDSYVESPSEAKAATVNVAMPPIVIQIIDSCDSPDITVNGVVIMASATVGKIGGSVNATVTDGLAIFNNLMITDAPTNKATVVFTAGEEGGYAVQRDTLVATFNVETTLKNNVNMRFRSTGSSFTAENQLITIRQGDVFTPPVLIEMVNSAALFDPSNTGITLTASLSSGTLSGASVTVTNGLATFNALNITSCPANQSSSLTFKPSGTTDPVSATQLVVAVNVLPLPNFNLRFGSTSYISAPDQSRSFSVGSVIPAIVLEVVNSCGGLDNATGLTVTVSSDKVPINGTLTVSVLKGVATFVDLVYRTKTADLPKLTFTAGREGNYLIAGKFVMSGSITLFDPPAQFNANMRFRNSNSLITAEGGIASIVERTNIPTISIELVDSNNNVDTSNSRLVITASTSSTDLTLLNNAVIVTSGIATFSNLQVVGCGGTSKSIKITFTAGNQDNLPVNGKTLTTGTVSISGLSGGNFRFKTDMSTLTKTQVNSSLPKIDIEFLTSCGDVDTAVSDLSVAVSTSDATLLTGSLTTLATNGVASLTDVRIRSCNTQRLNFKAVSPTTTYPVLGNQLTSQDITVTGSPNAMLGFATNSYITQSGQSSAATMSMTIPTVIVEIDDSCGTKMADNSKTVVSVTSSPSDGLEGGTLYGTAVKGSVTFAQIKFIKAASYTLIFTANDTTIPTIHGKTISTGVITVSATPVSASNIRFGSSGFFTAQDSTTKTVIQNSPMMPNVLLELLNSAALLDTSDTGSSITISATTSAPQFEVTPSSAVMFNGVATFTNMTFKTCTTTIPQVTLTFTAFSATKPVNGRVAVTVPVKVSGQPNSNLSFAPQGSAFTTENQPLSVNAGQKLPTIRINILDGCGNQDFSDSSIKMTATATPLISEGNSYLVGTTEVTVASGIATFSNLQFLSVPPDSLTITFTATSNVWSLNGRKLVTGKITVNNQGNFGLAFKVQPAGAIHNMPVMPSVVIQMIDSKGNPDLSSSGVVITATSMVAVAGESAIMVNGVATFDNLRFVACPTGGAMTQMTFTAGSQGGYPVQGKQVISQSIFVNGSSSASMQFNPGSFFLRNGDKQVVTKDITLPPVIIDLYDSCNIKDPSNNDIEVTVTAATGKLTGTTTKKAVNGVFMFNDLKFTEATDSAKLTFTANVKTGNYAVKGATVNAEVKVSADVIKATNIRFATVGSFFNFADTSKRTAIQDVPVSPPVLIELLDSSSALDPSDSAIVITAVASDSSIVLKGAVAVMNNGVAVFGNLTFSSCVSKDVVVSFIAGNQGAKPVTDKNLTSNMVSVIGTPNAKMIFGTISAFTNAGQSLSIVTGIPIPTIAIQLVDGCGRADSSDSTVKITVTTSAGTLSGKTTVTVSSGSALFTDLIFPTTPSTSPILTFTATSSAFAVNGAKLVTGTITVRAASNYDIRLGSTVTKLIHMTPSSPAITVEMLDSLMNPDTSSDSVVITASSPIVGALTQNQVTMSKGVAKFTSLLFIVCPQSGKATLTFTAGGQGSFPVAGKQTMTGEIQIVGKPNTQLAFSLGSFFVKSGDRQAITKNVAMPNVILEIQDSCGYKDSSSSDIEIRVTADSELKTSSILVKKVSSGTVTFSDLTFTNAGTARITFTAFATGMDINGQTLVTGDISVTNEPVSATSIRFSAANSFYTPTSSQSLVIYQNSPLTPSPIVELVDSSNSLDTKVNDIVVTATTSVSGIILNGNSAMITAGIANFSSLKVMTCNLQVPTLTITFTAGSQGSKPVANKFIISTSTTLAGRPNAQLGFVPTKGLINTIGQKVTASTGSVLPSIFVRVEDSCGQHNASVVPMAITASSDVGKLSGNLTVSTVNGVAEFSTLYFLETPTPNPDAQLSFQVSGPVLNYTIKCIVTVTVTKNYNIRFRSGSNFIKADGQADPVTHTKDIINPSIVVEMIDSLGNFNTNSETVITATTDRIGLLVNTQATMLSGIATFSGLKVVQCPNNMKLTLTFTAGGQGNYPVQGKRISTAEITVKSDAAFSMNFGSGSFFTKPSDRQYVMKSTDMPLIAIQLADSCGASDLTDGLSITVTSDGATIVGTATVKTSKGRADFKGLSLSDVGTQRLTFTAGPDQVCNKAVCPVNGKTLVVEAIVTLSAQPSSGIRFGAEGDFKPNDVTSKIIRDKDELFVQVDMLNSATQLDPSDNSTIITASSSEIKLGGGTVAKMNSGKASFQKLKLDSCPPKGIDSRITFTASGTGNLPVFGKSIFSPVLTVFGAPAYSMSASMVNSSTVGAFPNLPAFIVSSNDSCGVRSSTSVTFSASAEGGLDGTVNVSVGTDGKANFSSLRSKAASCPASKILTVKVSYLSPLPINYPASTTIDLPFTSTPRAKIQLTKDSPTSTTYTSGVPLEKRRISISDSCGNVDESDSSTVISATPSTSFTPTSTLTATVSKGVAEFTNLVLQSGAPNPPSITFTVAATNTTSALSLVIGPFKTSRMKTVTLPFQPISWDWIGGSSFMKAQSVTVIITGDDVFTFTGDSYQTASSLTSDTTKLTKMWEEGPNKKSRKFSITFGFTSSRRFHELAGPPPAPPTTTSAPTTTPAPTTTTSAPTTTTA